MDILFVYDNTCINCTLLMLMLVNFKYVQVELHGVKS